MLIAAADTHPPYTKEYCNETKSIHYPLSCANFQESTLLVETKVKILSVSITIKLESNQQMSSEEALRWCCDSPMWSEFGATVLEAVEKVDSTFLSGKYVHNIGNGHCKIDWRYNVLCKLMNAKQ